MKYKTAISRFEIAATDLARAQKFYEQIFDLSMIPMDLPNIKMRMFPLEDMMGVGTSRCDVFHQPSATAGPLFHLNANRTFK
ncbi:MAG: hypothetical protein C5B59_07705 [Bacteroidetes bacterium]|nr:MAG: hypothetical protein C5B59_07705 [Bacteroidota bacterium]